MKLINAVTTVIFLAFPAALGNPVKHLAARHSYALDCGDLQYYCTIYPQNYYCTAKGLPEANTKHGGENNAHCDRACNCIDMNPPPNCVAPLLGFQVYCNEVEDDKNQHGKTVNATTVNATTVNATTVNATTVNATTVNATGTT